MSFKADVQLAVVNPKPKLRAHLTFADAVSVFGSARATASPGCLDAGDAGCSVRESRGDAEQAAKHKTIQDTIVEIILAETASATTVSGPIYNK